MQIESKPLLLLVKQALLEKKAKTQTQLDEYFNQEHIFTSDLDVANQIIEHCDEIISAIDGELSNKHHS
jgi:hypothetical protein